MLLAAALVALPLLTACTVDPVDRSSGGSDAEVHTGPMRIAMITHGDDGGFWSIVRKGAEDCRRDPARRDPGLPGLRG